MGGTKDSRGKRVFIKLLHRMHLLQQQSRALLREREALVQKSRQLRSEAMKRRGDLDNQAGVESTEHGAKSRKSRAESMQPGTGQVIVRADECLTGRRKWIRKERYLLSKLAELCCLNQDLRYQVMTLRREQRMLRGCGKVERLRGSCSGQAEAWRVEGEGKPQGCAEWRMLRAEGETG